MKQRKEVAYSDGSKAYVQESASLRVRIEFDEIEPVEEKAISEQDYEAALYNRNKETTREDSPANNDR